MNVDDVFVRVLSRDFSSFHEDVPNLSSVETGPYKMFSKEQNKTKERYVVKKKKLTPCFQKI